MRECRNLNINGVAALVSARDGVAPIAQYRIVESAKGIWIVTLILSVKGEVENILPFVLGALDEDVVVALLPEQR